jgi:hypothetical protein
MFVLRLSLSWGTLGGPRLFIVYIYILNLNGNPRSIHIETKYGVGRGVGFRVPKEPYLCTHSPLCVVPGLDGEREKEFAGEGEGEYDGEN